MWPIASSAKWPKACMCRSLRVCYILNFKKLRYTKVKMLLVDLKNSLQNNKIIFQGPSLKPNSLKLTKSFTKSACDFSAVIAFSNSFFDRNDARNFEN